MPETSASPIAIVGAGPAGLIAAERLAQKGRAVTVFERMPSPARKFLLAGRGGLNLTHSEPLERFLARYPSLPPRLESAIRAFPPEALRAWAAGLGEEPFAGTSGRVFPKSFKATPLTRAWLRRLDSLGVRFAFRHRWTGWAGDGVLTFDTPDGPRALKPAATLLALGGASWPRLGSDGGWRDIVAARGIPVTPLAPSNVGISIAWSEAFRTRNAGTPLKGIRISVGGAETRAEAVITETGLEGGATYALSAPIRAALDTGGASLTLDLKPDVSEAALAARLAASRRGESFVNILRKATGLPPLAAGLLRETFAHPPRDPAALAAALKALPLAITAMRPLDRAISTAGGVRFDALTDALMIKALPGVFIAGEMLDWDAPTGGYLLQACFSTGVAAAESIVEHLESHVAQTAPKR